MMRRSEQQQDLEILLLRQQLRILQRQHPTAPRVSRCEQRALALRAAQRSGLGHGTQATLDRVLCLFKPDTVLRWHRDLVRRTWTFKRRRASGRPVTDPELQALLPRLAAENSRGGYSKLHGESGAPWAKLGYAIGRSTVSDSRKRQHVPPAPERAKQSSRWREFLSHYGQQIVAGACLTVETAWLQTRSGRCFIEVSSRRVHSAGCTAHPTAEWVPQPARQLSWTV